MKKNRITGFSMLLLIIVVIIFSTRIEARKFPKKTGPKKVTLHANYRSKKITLTETLYRSVNNYYASEPKKETVGHDYYGSFVFSYQEDKTIENLTKKIKKLGEKLGLNSDETMDLAINFVQSIPYDESKGKIVLSKKLGKDNSSGDLKATLGRFPYETLYDNKGICTDKSYLLAAILKNMGYGVSLLVFDKEMHMAVGVKAPQGYTSFNTKYSYIETTNTGFKVGQLPIIDKNSGAANNPEINNLPKGAEEKADEKFLQPVPKSNFSAPSKVYIISNGRKYFRIIKITKILNRINELIPKINNGLKELIAMKKELSDGESAVKVSKNETKSYEQQVLKAEKIYKKNPTPGNYSYYSKVYEEYRISNRKTDGVIRKYNKKVDFYNSKNKKLNALIDEYNELIKMD